MAQQKFLIVVDMQNDFIDGALGTPEAQGIVDRAARYIRSKVKGGYQVIATLDTHAEDYLNTQEGRLLPVPHCVMGTDGWKMRKEILDAIGDDSVMIVKHAFGAPAVAVHIHDSIAEGDDLFIEVVGLCTDICVVSNALLLKSFFPDAVIRVKRSCCAGTTPKRHRAALETMRACQIEVI